MKPKFRHIRSLAIASSALLAISYAHAQSTLTWDAGGGGGAITNGAGAWLSPNLWNDGGVAATWTSGDNAIFGGVNSAGGSVTLASPTTVGTLTFDQFTGTYTLGTAGQALTINDGITMNAGSGEVTFASPIVLGAAQSWLNNTSAVDTTLRVNSTIDNGGFDLTLGGTATSINRSDSNFLLTGVISGSGGLNKTGDGVLWLSGTNTYTGATTVTGGVLRNQGGNLSGMTSGNITLNGGVLESYWNDTFTRSLGAGTNQIQLTGGASGFSQHGGAGLTVTLNNNATTPIQWGSTHFNPSTLVFMSIYSNSGANVTFNNAIDLNGAQRAIEVNQGAGFTNVRTQMNGVLSDTVGGAGITKTGDGTLILTNNSNSYDGPTIVNGGVLQIGTSFNAGNLSLPGGYTSNPSTGSNLELDGGIVSYFFSFNRTLGTGAGQLQLTGGRSGFTIKQGDRVDLTFNTAATEVQWGSAVFNPSTLVLNDAAAAPSSPIRFNNLLDLNGATRTVDVANFTTTINTNGAATGAFSRVINNGAVLNNNIRNADTENTAGLIKTGVGILGFNGTNTYDGGTDVQQGGVFFNSLASMPANGAVSLANGTSLVVSVGGGGQWTTGTGGNGTVGGLLAGLGGQSGGTVSYTGDVTLGLNVHTGTQTYTGDIANASGGTNTGIAAYSTNGNGVLVLSGNNTHTGGTAVYTGATLGIGSSSLGSGTFTFAGGALQSSDSTARTVSNSIVLGGNVTIGGTGNIAFTDTSNTQVSNTNNSTRTFTIASGVTTSFDQTFTANGNSGITKTGLGDMVLNGTNSFTGNVTVQQGNLIAGGNVPSVNNQNGAFGRANSTINVGVANNNNDAGVLAGGAFTIGRNFQVLSQNGTDTGTRTVTFGGNAAEASTFAGNIILGSNSQATKGINVTAASGGSVTFSGVISNPTGQDTAEQNTAAAGTAITKVGLGTVSFTNTNTYTGATNITAGTLEISGAGSINSTTAINVAAGASFIYNSSTALTVAPTLQGSGGSRASFSGSGTVNAAMTLNSLDSVLAPGNSPGIQAFGIGQTWESFTYEWELNDWTDQVAGTNIDQIQIAGGLTLSGTLYALSIFSLDALNAAGLVGANGGNLFAETSNSWTILTTTGGISGFDASNWALDTSGFQDSETGTWSLASTGNDLVLSYTVIPEPSTALLAALGVLALLRRRR